MANFSVCLFFSADLKFLNNETMPQQVHCICIKNNFDLICPLFFRHNECVWDIRMYCCSIGNTVLQWTDVRIIYNMCSPGCCITWYLLGHIMGPDQGQTVQSAKSAEGSESITCSDGPSEYNGMTFLK